MVIGVATALILLLLGLLFRQHLAWAAAAERAVLVDERPGAFAAAVSQAEGPVVTASIPRQPVASRADAADGPVGLSTGGAPTRPRFGSVADNVAIGGAVGVAGLADWWHVDDHVFRAVEALMHEHIGNSIDLWSTVHDHHYKIGEALFVSLRGHVGEQMAADHLAAAGLHVSWPEASNQPGWDLGLGNHVVNVKVTGNAATTLAEHFDKYPDIPALINADAAHIPHDAIAFDPSHGFDPSALVGDHVTLVDHALSLHEAAASVHDAFGAAVDAHIPVVGVLVTVARSGTREGKLVREGHTDVQRALKNVAIDTAARGGGVMAGGLAGAAAGAHVDAFTGGLTMGLGTVIGGIVGAVGGAMAGSAAASHVRLAPLRDAWQRLQRDLHGYEQAVDVQQKYVTAQVASAADSASRELAQRQQAATGRLKVDLEQLRKETARASAFDAARVLEQSFADVERRSETLPDDLARPQPQTPDLYLRRALRRRIAALRQRAHNLVGDAGNGGPESEKFWDIIACSTNGHAALRGYVQGRVAAQRRAHRDAVGRAIAEVTVHQLARSAAQHDVFATLEQAKADAVAAIEPQAERLQGSVATFEREALAAERSSSS